ncbi:DUF2283 domain-containing protein [Microbacterium karelineae]|uniref:DUF2283 domain-containing protein n=1 Tax=Microbacterium karelineae TaxID=2654283 RepID=UPI0018D3A748|nr:DUF2283 domain-containing protein [Microbacterium karelineae]
MNLSCDPEADAAYADIVDDIGVRGVAKTVSVDSAEVEGMMNMGFDHEGHLVGIEILDARRYSAAEILGESV